MLDYIIMLIILLFLGIMILYKAKLFDENETFFDAGNSGAMRGFWCIVIILVHIPAAYQNRIQDMIGSFAYIGVTFFFMTSAYGLTLSQIRSPECVRGFWIKRLPKILIVSWITNIISALANLALLGKKTGIFKMLLLNDWIYWIIACYFAFWISNLVFKDHFAWKASTVTLVTAGSLIMYYLKKNGVVTTTIWSTEVFGFAWGIILASLKQPFMTYFIRKWWIKCSFSAVASVVIGVAYIKLKTVPFMGDYILKIVLGIAITLFILVVNTRVNFGNVISLYIGAVSFEVYLVHLVVIDVLDKAFTWPGSGIFIVTCIVITLLLAPVVHFLSRQSFLVIRNIVVNGKKNIKIL